MAHVIVFDPDGRFGMLYDDRALPYISTLGKTETLRASDVEPDGTGWSARIRDWVPGGAAKLGPYSTRQEALEAEIAYLREAL